MNPRTRRFSVVQSDKENLKPTLTGKESADFNSGTRHPLSNLCDNVVLLQKCSNVRTFRKSTTTCTTTEIFHDAKSRSNSESGAEGREKYYLRPYNVVDRIKDHQIVDEVFVESSKKQWTYFEQKKTEVLQTLPVAAKAPARKITLVKKPSRRCNSTISGIRDLCINGLYDMDYFSHNYRHMVATEEKFIFIKQYLAKYIDYNARLMVVSWLIYAQQILDLSEPTLFAAVRMFDKFLMITNEPSKKYGLVGITTLWIASKFFDRHVILVPMLFALCNGSIAKQDIISMEKQILKTLEFQVNFPEPSLFLYFYMKQMKLESKEIIWFGAMFLLETFMLLFEFSSSAPSLLACSALYLVLIKYNVDCTLFVKYIDFHLIKEELFKKYASQMETLVKELLKNRSQTFEVVEKYSLQERFRVAQYFISS